MQLSDIQDLKDLKDLNEALSAVEVEVTDISNNLNELEKQVVDLNSCVDDLENGNSDLLTSIPLIQEQIVIISDEIVSFGESINELNSQLEILNANETSNTEDIQALQSLIKEKATQIEDGTKSFASINESFNALSAQVTGLGIDEKFATTESSIKKLITDLDKKLNSVELKYRNIMASAGATSFTQLNDVPSSYSGQALKAIRVNAGANALEFYTPSGGGGGTPGGYTTQLQYNNAGAFGGISRLTYNNGTDILALGANSATPNTVQPAVSFDSITFSNQGAGFYTADGSNVSMTVYAYRLLNEGSLVYENAGVLDVTADPGGDTWDIDYSFTASPDATGYIIYWSEQNIYIDVGNGTSGTFTTFASWTAGFPPLTPTTVNIPAPGLYLNDFPWYNPSDDYGTTNIFALQAGNSSGTSLRLWWNKTRWVLDDTNTTTQTLQANIAGNVTGTGLSTFEDVHTTDLNVAGVTALVGTTTAGLVQMNKAYITTDLGLLNGTVAIPVIYQSSGGSNNGTGIYFPATDSIAIAISGTQAWNINSSRNIGTGVSASSTIRQLIRGTNSAGQLELQYDASNKANFYVNSTGSLTMTLTGTTPKFIFANANDIQVNSIGTTSTDAQILENTTAAAAGAQQYSPRLRFKGNGWRTNATAGSQTVEYIMEVQPIQGAASPTGKLVLLSSVNGAAYPSAASAGAIAFGTDGTVYTSKITSSDSNIISVSAPGDFRLSSGKFMVGTAVAATAQLEAQGTGEHLRFRYDASNRTSFTTGSTGILTLALTGTAPRLTLTGGGLTLPAGSATAGTSPLKFATGTKLTTAEAGVQEFDTNFYFTNNNSIRYSVGGVLPFDNFADVSVGGAETDIYSATTLVNTLGINGGKIVASYGGNFVTVGTEIVQLKVYFGGTAIWDSTGIAVTTGTTSWNVDVKIIRVSSTVVRYNVTLNTTGASGFVYNTVGELTGLTLSNTNVLKITGTSSGVGSGVGDIVGKMSFIKFETAG